MRKYIIALVMSLVAMAASAQRFKVGDIYYKVTSPGCVSVTGENDLDCYSGHVVIPKKVVHDNRTYVVNEIGPTAFADCDGVTCAADRRAGLLGLFESHASEDSVVGAANHGKCI